MAFKIILQLKRGVKPHLTLEDLKARIESQGYLHPLMENALKVMKKSRMAYLPLAHRKEVVFVPEKYLHFEAGLEPQHTGFARIDWTPEEKEEYDTQPKKFLKDIFDMYKQLGYEILNEEEVLDDRVEFLMKNTNKKNRGNNNAKNEDRNN